MPLTDMTSGLDGCHSIEFCSVTIVLRAYDLAKEPRRNYSFRISILFSIK